MFAFFFSLALISAHAKDTVHETTTAEVFLARDPFLVGLRPDPTGELRLRVEAGDTAGRTNRLLAASFEERGLAPEFKFRNVLSIDGRAFATLADGRLIEIALSVDRGRTIGRRWLARLSSAGLGAGTALIGAGGASGSGSMAATGAALLFAGGALPFVLPSLGFALYVDWNLNVIGGDAPWTTEDVVMTEGRISDLQLGRGKEHVLLSQLIHEGRDCAQYLGDGTFERTR